ncbi:phage major capsid protein [Kaistia geumhonensis]|uniref:HK97 family phage major capsid protein n=1 Tax=Kaistia geumhonensis TaxID=410839 RepID=A0ABU0M5T2_9HYPH|nr:phage major capsid protein [Kaistia geumhonensis]MCX5478459.1 phage major capsid protein [Kaistia geumhonensis]MDQ0516323.1 HK97 family phage major capsid protein [Kaistia geumhonensis]
MDLNEIKGLLDKQGEAFDAFKKSHTEQLDELKKKGATDPLLVERMGKVEKALDSAVEAKAAIEAKLEAEKKEREALEARINREGIKAGSVEEAKRAIEIKDFNVTLAAVASDQKRGFAPLDEKGYDAYKSAFNGFLRKNERLLTAEEVKTLSVGSDPDGGYFVTPDITGRIVKKVYETSPIRQIASVQAISTDALEGIEDNGEAGAGYAGEMTQGSDTTTPQVGKWRIPVFWIDTEPKATQQLLDDAAVDIEGWLSGKVGDKFSRFENSEFVNGAANKILGLAKGYTAAADSGAGVTWGQVGYVATGSDGAFAGSNPADKLIDLMGALKGAYLNNARWLTRRSVVTLIRKFKDGQGNYLWQPAFTLGTPESIMGFPVTRAEDMPAVASNSYSLAFGDFAAAYQIVDRQGIRVLRDPYTAKPFIKFYTTKRVGGGVVNFEAYKLLKFGTS